MKIFRVVTQRDGETTAVPGSGKRTTEINQIDRRYAAETIEEVWEEIIDIRQDEDETLIAIVEEHPAIQIIGKW